MEILIRILQLILALSALIVVHELGHFVFARLFKIRVDKFYLFFDIGGKAIVRFRPKNSHTEYGIGWLPLGGYCKIAGMVDESMDTEALKQDPQPWEFRTHPAWQRLLVMAGGVLFNFIFAILLYICIVATWGENYISNEESCIYVNELAYDMGFRNGDRILKLDDYVPENFGMLQADLARHTARKATVLRNGDTLDIYIDHNRIGEILNSPGMFSLAVPFIVDSVASTSANHGSGLMKGDRIAAIDGINVDFIQDSWKLLPEYSGKEVDVTVLRGNDTIAMPLQVDTAGKFGIYPSYPMFKTKEYSAIEAIPAGFKLTFNTVGGYLQDLKLVFTPSTEAYKSVGSFIAIGQIFPPRWDWFSFINILAILSIMLGVMNLLPIPALDGGHIVFTIYEMITGHRPGDKFMVRAQIIGMFLLLCIMVLAFSNDISRLLR